MTTTTMTCIHCGAQATGDELYCPACGLAFIPGSGATALAAAPSTTASSESRSWALAAHVTAMFGAVAGGVAAFVGPLVVWLLRRDADPFSAEHARQALNFNLSVLLYAAVAFVGGLIATVLSLGLALIVLVPLGVLALVAYAVVSVLGAVAASNGRPFAYPGALPLVR